MFIKLCLKEFTTILSIVLIYLDVSQRGNVLLVEHSGFKIDPAYRTVGHQEILNNLQHGWNAIIVTEYFFKDKKKGEGIHQETQNQSTFAIQFSRGSF